MFDMYPRQQSSDNGNSGTRRDTSTSASALVSTLIPTVIAGIIFLAVFLLLRKKKRNVYAPRTYVDVVADE
jgi:calcium permeable stress-gated cation channel